MKNPICITGQILLAASLLVMTPARVSADGTNAAPMPARNQVNQTAVLTEEDHQAMMDLLGIKTLRRGRDGGNPSSPYYANYDEAKANPYPDLPEVLTLKNGEKVTTPERWWQQRRPEIIEDFDREIYGRVPTNVPAVRWEVVSKTMTNNGAVAVITKQLIGHVDNSADTNITVDIEASLTTPANSAGPVPVMIQLNFNFAAFNRLRGTNSVAPRVFGGGTNSWQRQVLARGWGYATLTPTTVQADNGAGLMKGIIGLANGGKRRADDWGALRAWAWGASRLLDYFETDPAVDAKHVGIEGHSRYGKAALVAMAYDQRFAFGYISSSGEGGAKLHRRDWGEVVENLTGNGEYHWMAGNFIKYGGPLNWNDLPVDAHELIALCAPRPVFISAGSTNGDAWVDAKGMFMAAAAAGPVYRLLGKRDMGTTEFPPMGTALTNGEVAFRQHFEGHTDVPNWPTFLDFAGRYVHAGSTPDGR